MGRVWGGEAPAGVSTYSLGSKTCHIKTYLEEHLGARFRGRLRLLYPEFMQRVREVLRAVIEFALRNGRKASDSETVQIVEEKWPPDQQKDHPHLSLYRPRVLRWARALAQAFDPTNFVGATLREEPFEWTDDSGVSRIIKLQLIGHFDDGNGDHFAVALQVDSADESAAEVKWSQLKDYQRLPFVLLHQRHGDVQPRVFVGEKGELLSFRWSQRRPEESTRVQADAARQVFQRLTSGIFDGTTNDWACDRCPCRTICPGWIGAIQKDKVI